MQGNKLSGKVEEMKDRIVNIASGLGYYILFIGINILVSLIVEVAYGVYIGIELSSVGGNMPTQEEAVQMYMEFYNRYAVTITLIYQIITFLIVYWIFRIRKKQLREETMLVALKKKDILPIIVLGLTVQLFLSYAIELLPIPEDIMNEYAQASSPVLQNQNIILKIISVVIIAPFVEEVVFRGIILRKFGKAMPIILAVILSSCLFGLGHGQIVWMIYTAVLGILFSIMMLQKKSVTASILMHMVFNFLGLFIELIPCSKDAMITICIVAFVLMISTWIFLLQGKGYAKI